MKISFIGSGNVAYNLATNLENLGEDILTIVSPKISDAEYLAHKVGAKGEFHIDLIDKRTEIVFLCVPDDKIAEVSKEIRLPGVIQVHTSGSVPLSAIDVEERGVMYPLQSLKRGFDINLLDVPFLLEANTIKTEIALDKLASKISNIIRFKNSHERRNLHLSAVFANNFTNHILHVSQNLCKENGLDFEFLKPLVVQTIANAFSLGAGEAQTGPAIRNDVQTMDKHMAMLEGNPAALEVYKVISKSIQEMHIKTSD